MRYQTGPQVDERGRATWSRGLTRQSSDQPPGNGEGTSTGSSPELPFTDRSLAAAGVTEMIRRA